MHCTIQVWLSHMRHLSKTNLVWNDTIYYSEKEAKWWLYGTFSTPVDFPSCLSEFMHIMCLTKTWHTKRSITVSWYYHDHDRYPSWLITAFPLFPAHILKYRFIRICYSSSKGLTWIAAINQLLDWISSAAHCGPCTTEHRSKAEPDWFPGLSITESYPSSTALWGQWGKRARALSSERPAFKPLPHASVMTEQITRLSFYICWRGMITPSQGIMPRSWYMLSVSYYFLRGI